MTLKFCEKQHQMTNHKLVCLKCRNEKDRALLEILLGALPTRHGGAKIGKNYWSGYAKGNNDTLDEVEKMLRDILGFRQELREVYFRKDLPSVLENMEKANHV